MIRCKFLYAASNDRWETAQLNKTTMPPVEVIANHELCVTRCMRKYIWSHRSRKCTWSHRSRKSIWSHRFTRVMQTIALTRRPAKVGRNRSRRAGDIKDLIKSKMLDLVQRLKLIGNISVASVRRPAKFGRNRSRSRDRDVTDFSKSKMAAEPPCWT